MNKKLKVGGAIAAAATSAALLAGMVTGTGAYFTDTVSGGIVTGDTGSVDLRVMGDTVVSFNDLLPGDAKNHTIRYYNDGETAYDLYMVLTPESREQLAAWDKRVQLQVIAGGSTRINTAWADATHDVYAGTFRDTGLLQANLAPGAWHELHIRPSMDKTVTDQTPFDFTLKFDLVAVQAGGPAPGA